MKMYQVDAFSQALFKGNPAAVLVLKDWLADDLMQNIALENNLSETAFLKKIDEQNYQIRWFTPSKEVDFCGHATLASAFVLFKDFTSKNTVYFDVKGMGIFTISQDNSGKISMNFPIRAADKLDSYPQILQELVTSPIQAVYLNQQAYIVELIDYTAVKHEQPEAAKLQQLNQWAIEHLGAGRGLALTAQDEQYDCISRYFSPNIDYTEDPVTGSIHTAIAPLWAERLGKHQITAYQASQRGGVLYCEMKDQNRIEISGYAKLYMVAELDLVH